MIRSDASEQSGEESARNEDEVSERYLNAETWGNAHLQTMIENRVRVRLCDDVAG